MKPIGDYEGILSSRTLEQFLAYHPPGVLLQDTAKGSFQALDGKPGETLFRFYDLDSPSPSEDSIPKAVRYMVLLLRSARDHAATRLLVGCSEACDVEIRDKSVSREHAWIECREDAYYIRDSESTIGTRVNSKRLQIGEERKLNNSDRVTIGTVDTTFFDPVGFYLFAKEFLGV